MTAQGPGPAQEPPREPATAGSQPPAAASAASPADGQPAPGKPARAPRTYGKFGILGAVLGAIGHVVATPYRLLRRRFPWLTLRTRRGKLVALFLVAGVGSAITVGGVMAVHWTETADFCGRCHTMDPELKAHAMSPHRELACAECHVEPGVEGWVKAKLNGTRQLVQLITGTFPTPIPPPDHGDLPPTDATCRRCHDAKALVANGGPVQLVLKTRFELDEPNSKSTVAMVLRPAGFSETGSTRGVHWHIDMDVEYSSTDRRSQKIEVVTVTDKAGNTTEYVANHEVTNAAKVQADIDSLIKANPLQRMDCIDCHNRIGHRVPSLAEAIDSSMESGLVSQTLPYIKQQATTVLGGDYTNAAAAETAIDGIRDFYATKYPLVVSQRSVVLDNAITELKMIYNLVATPEMRVSASTYPDNLGHKEYPGCFRCHDGSHFKVVKGQLTKEAIPSQCSTCHTFPQVGSSGAATSFLIGERPQSHTDRMWLFNHKALATNANGQATASGSGSQCAACHTQSYCENCHSSPAINVPHTNMPQTHPAIIRKVGLQTCALCHQPGYCERCHPNGIIGFSNPRASTGTGE